MDKIVPKQYELTEEEYEILRTSGEVTIRCPNHVPEETTSVYGLCANCWNTNEIIISYPTKNAQSYINMVEDFHRKINALVSSSPRLLDEEWVTYKGVTYRLSTFRHMMHQEENNEYLMAQDNKDVVEILDALVDLQYFLLGSVIMHGLQDRFWLAFEEVHRSNMSKTANANGKAIKGEGYFPPNLRRFFE